MPPQVNPENPYESIAKAALGGGGALPDVETPLAPQRGVQGPQMANPYEALAKKAVSQPAPASFAGGSGLDPNAIRSLQNVCAPGTDCSLFSQTVLSKLGRKVPRTAIQQYQATARVDDGSKGAPDFSRLQPGDLVFFDTGVNRTGDRRTGDGRYITHVGIYLGNGRMLHDPGKSGDPKEVDLAAYSRRFKYNGAGRSNTPSSFIETVPNNLGVAKSKQQAAAPSLLPLAPGPQQPRQGGAVAGAAFGVGGGAIANAPKQVTKPPVQGLPSLDSMIASAGKRVIQSVNDALPKNLQSKSAAAVAAEYADYLGDAIERGDQAAADKWNNALTMLAAGKDLSLEAKKKAGWTNQQLKGELIEGRKAVVAAREQLRDRLNLQAKWNGKKFVVTPRSGVVAGASIGLAGGTSEPASIKPGLAEAKKNLELQKRIDSLPYTLADLEYSQARGLSAVRTKSGLQMPLGSALKLYMARVGQPPQPVKPQSEEQQANEFYTAYGKAPGTFGYTPEQARGLTGGKPFIPNIQRDPEKYSKPPLSDAPQAIQGEILRQLGYSPEVIKELGEGDITQAGNTLWNFTKYFLPGGVGGAMGALDVLHVGGTAKTPQEAAKILVEGAWESNKFWEAGIPPVERFVRALNAGLTVAAITHGGIATVGGAKKVAASPQIRAFASKLGLSAKQVDAATETAFQRFQRQMARAPKTVEAPAAKPLPDGLKPVDYEAIAGKAVGIEAKPQERGSTLPVQPREVAPPTPETPAIQAREFMSAEGRRFVETRIDPNTLGVMPGLQFKRAGITDTANAVTDTYRRVTKYDQATGGPLTAWQTNDGKLWVMNGHHRREIAIRTGEPDVPVRIFKESDGIGFDEARALGALQNLKDQKGTALDIATVLREMDFKPEDLARVGVDPKQTLAKDALSLLKLDADALRYVEDGSVPEVVAAGIADVGLDPRYQVAVMKEAMRGELTTRMQGSILADQARLTPLVDRSGGMGDLFGEFSEGLVLAEQAKISEAVQKRLMQNQRLLNAMNRGKAVGDTKIDADAQTAAAQVQEIARQVIATDQATARRLEKEAVAYAQTPTRKRFIAAVDQVVREAEAAAARRLEEINSGAKGEPVKDGVRGRSESGPGVREPAKDRLNRISPEKLAELDAQTLKHQAATDRIIKDAEAKGLSKEAIREIEDIAEVEEVSIEAAVTPDLIAAASKLPGEKQAQFIDWAVANNVGDAARLARAVKVFKDHTVLTGRSSEPEWVRKDWEVSPYEPHILKAQDELEPAPSLEVIASERPAPKSDVLTPPQKGMDALEPEVDLELRPEAGNSKSKRKEKPPQGSMDGIADDADGQGGLHLSTDKPLARGGKKPDRIAPVGKPGGFDGQQSDLIGALGDLVDRVILQRKRTIKGAAGFYDPTTTQTTTRRANDFDVAFHETAHALDDKYGLLADYKGDIASPFDKELKWFYERGGSGGPFKPLDYNRAEGVAEYVRALFVNPNKARGMAPEFTKHFEANVPKTVLAEIERISDMFQRWYDATPLEKTRATIRTDKPAPPTRIEAVLDELTKNNGEGYSTPFITRKLTTAVLDDMAPFVKGVEEAAKRRGFNLDGLKPSNNPITLLRALPYFGRKFDAVIRDGMTNKQGDIVTKPFEDIFAPLDQSSKEAFTQDLKDLESLLVSERTMEKADFITKAAAEAVDAYAQKLEDGLTAAVDRFYADAQAKEAPVVARAIGRIEGRAKAENKPQAWVDAQTKKVKAESQKRINEGVKDFLEKTEILNRKRVERYANIMAKKAERQMSRLTGAGSSYFNAASIADDTLRQLMNDPAKFTRLSMAANGYRKWADSVLTYMVSKGRMSQEAYFIIKSRNEYYAAMNRVLEENPLPEFVRKNNVGRAAEPIKKFEGSMLTIDSPLANLLKFTYTAMKESDRNETLAAFVKLLKARRRMYEGQPTNLAAIGQQVDPGTPGAVRVFVGGQPTHWLFEEGIADSIEGIARIVVPGTVGRFFRGLVDLERSTITKLPPFVIRNRIRDTQDVLLKSQHNFKANDWIKKANDEEKRLYEFFGGGIGRDFYLENVKDFHDVRNRIADELLRDKNTVLLDPRKLVGKSADAYLKFVDSSELQPRMAEMRAASREGAKKYRSVYDQRLYASKSTRDLIDFARGGTLTKFISTFVVPFVNARVQGQMSLYEATKHHPGKFGRRWLAVNLAPTLAEYAWNRAQGDENLEEYRALPAWQRDLFYNFKAADNLWVRIPKNHEPAVVASLFGRMADNLLGNEKAYDGWGGSFADSLKPVDFYSIAGGVPGFGSLMEARDNINRFTEKPIVPEYEEDLALELRKGTANASHIGQWIQAAIGKLSNNAVGVDARKVDHVLTGLFNDAGRLALLVGDLVTPDAEVPGKKPEGKPTAVLLNSGLGIFAQSPASQAPEVAWVSEMSKQSGVRMNPLGKLLAAVYDAEDDKTRDAASRDLRKAAMDLRARAMRAAQGLSGRSKWEAYQRVFELSPWTNKKKDLGSMLGIEVKTPPKPKIQTPIKPLFRRGSALGGGR